MVTFHLVDEFPPNMGLSLANCCSGKCIWCPIGKGIYTPRKNRFMSMEIVEKVIVDYGDKWPRELWVSENGGPLMHPKFKQIVTRLREAFPKSGLCMASNMLLMDQKMIDFVLDMEFYWVGFNLDGITQRGYEAVKGIPFKIVENNILKLIKSRNERGPDCKTTLHASILTQPFYYLTTHQTDKITVADESLQVFQALRNLLQWGTKDTILMPFPMYWAERKRMNKPKGRNICAGMYQVGHKIYINTDGDTYICCMDYDTEKTFGNVLQNTIHEIWHSEPRKTFLKYLYAADFAKIGLPCSICQD